MKYRESLDGGTRHVHANRDVLPKDWTLRDGPMPGPDMVKAEVDARLREEMWVDMEKQQRWIDRRTEIELEVRDARA